MEDIAIQRIRKLFRMAEEVLDEYPQLAKRYVELAVNISRRCKVRMPKAYKMRICKHCGTLLRPGVNCRVRIRRRRSPHVTITCLECKKHMRYPIRS